MFELGQQIFCGKKSDGHREKQFFLAVILVVITTKTDFEKCVTFQSEVCDCAIKRVTLESHAIVTVSVNYDTSTLAADLTHFPKTVFNDFSIKMTG